MAAVGYRQWVLSSQGPMAVRLGYDQALLATIAESLARAVMQDMRASVKERHGLASARKASGGASLATKGGWRREQCKCRTLVR